MIATALFCTNALAQSKNQFSPDYKPGDSPGYIDNRTEWREERLKLPAYPKQEDLAEFTVSALNSFRFFVDTKSIQPAADGTVRYTLVARSSSGVENVSFNGLRCGTGEHRLFANGRPADQSWSEVRDSKWKVVEVRTITRQHLVLMRDFFCPGAVAIYTAAEGIDALKHGYHPHAVSNHPPDR